MQMMVLKAETARDMQAHMSTGALLEINVDQMLIIFKSIRLPKSWKSYFCWCGRADFTLSAHWRIE